MTNMRFANKYFLQVYVLHFCLHHRNFPRAKVLILINLNLSTFFWWTVAFFIMSKKSLLTLGHEIFFTCSLLKYMFLNIISISFFNLFLSGLYSFQLTKPLHFC